MREAARAAAFSANIDQAFPTMQPASLKYWCPLPLASDRGDFGLFAVKLLLTHKRSLGPHASQRVGYRLGPVQDRLVLFL